MTWAQPINLNGAVEEDRFDDWSARPPNVDLDRLCRDQGVTGDLSKLRKYRLDLLACIDGLDHEGEILRKTEYVGCMENPATPRRTVAPEIPADCRASTIASSRG